MSGRRADRPRRDAAVQGLHRQTILPADYYRPAHELIHGAILALYAAGEPDPITTAAELTKRGQLARCGGTDYLHPPSQRRREHRHRRPDARPCTRERPAPPAHRDRPADGPARA
ncbi:DnaB-like helicase N-terminal domain-containing protein [Kitasatospora sp. NPDC058190]|uniref:DnaB-like helicase N-terminal domain-containing protein n=1 Tax=Kitasatospora sp. NPDC058190 TaxID=3346371 RepID=UPI0036D8B657